MRPFAPIPAPSLTGAVDKLAAWRTDTLRDEEQAVERPVDVGANVSGYWWSTPALSRLPTTTRALLEFGAAGLLFIEDGFGWRAARCIPVAPVRPARVYEIRDAQDWVELVSRYPLEVTLSRRHDWWRATGAEGQWLIPDYQAVSGDYDALHLTTCAYLAAAGVAHQVGTSLTLLAGWNPDQTYWLTDRLRPAGQPELWAHDPQSEWFDWTPTAEAPRTLGSG